MAHALRGMPNKRSDDKGSLVTLRHDGLASMEKDEEAEERKRWKQKCVGCRKRGHTINECPCRNLHGDRKSGSGSKESSRERTKQRVQTCSECGETGHHFLDGDCPLLQDAEWDSQVQERKTKEKKYRSAGSSNDEMRKTELTEDEGEGAERNALPKFPIVQDMRRAIKQEGEELAEKNKLHYLSVGGINSIETLERQDDMLEINQRDNQNQLKV